ncbi:RHS domain-containing protein [Pseudomonas sp. SD17-1]|uniref:RHS repeat-associated core domain-containing protein n=3 Tax=unclassified Pseudomonas TaxID=196821 RepID=UPI0023DB13A2|nr:RHS repeat-associated core domain-containing protein [Pseudomonas sp. SD17-1]WEJ21579.1 RHS domain-containing protein [Pseudomonas sp. SD17-1]
MSDNTPAKQRPPQAAVVPLDQIGIEDVSSGAAVFDAWLRDISGGYVNLERLKEVAEVLPVIGNIIALVDAVGDVVNLASSDKPDPLDWVSLGINLIGVIPTPPTMAAARKSLRPMLVLARQEGKQMLGDSLIEIIVGHLNATLLGEIDAFLADAEGQLEAILKECADVGEKLVNNTANAIDAVITGKLDSAENLEAAGRSAIAAKNALRSDPSVVFENAFAALSDAYAAMGKGAANMIMRNAVPEGVQHEVLARTRALRSLAPQMRTQLMSMTSAANPQSIESMRLILHNSSVLWHKRNPKALGSTVKGDKTTQARHQDAKGETEAITRQASAKQAANDSKNGTCASSCNRINFALGSESLDHTDFSLPGPFPVIWTRTYNSRLERLDNASLGARWLTEFTTCIDVVGQGLVLLDFDGRSHDFPMPEKGKPHYDAVEYLTLVRTGEQQLVLLRGLDRRETYARHGDRFYLTHIQLRSGAGAMLHYEHRHNGQPVLSDINTYQDDDPSKVHLQLGTRLDAHGHIQGLWQVVDGKPLRQLCAYHYDGAGDLVAAQDENGAAWHYAYQHHLVTRYTDRTGRGFNLEWDGNGPHARAIHEWADDGSFEVRLEWDERIRLTYVTDAHGQETWHYYDIQGYTYRIRHPDGNSEWLFRDERKNIIRHVHPDGSQERYSFDERSNLLQHIRPDHSTLHYAYDDHDQLIKIRDAEGGLWLRDYDERGNLVETVDPLGNKTEFAYTPSGLVSAIKDANGNQKALAYNDAGQLLEYVDCSGKTSQWAYNDFGQLVQFADAAGNKTAYEYKAGQLSRVTHPDNTEERFERDAEGRLLAYLDALDRCTTWTYSGAGLLAERVDANEHTLRYRWDKLGRLIGLENENTSQASFVYDPVGRLLQETGFDGLTTRYQYDPYSGRLASTQVGQRRIDLRFDPMGRLAERTARLGDQSQTERFAYDGNGRLIQAINAASQLQWFHDEAGNLTREHQHYLGLQQPVVAVWTHEYDVLNQRIATVRPDGHTVSWLTYGSGHLLGMKLDQHDMLSYERDDLHREVARHQGNKLMQTQAWDPAGRLQEQLLGSHDGKSTLLKRQYQYDGAGQLTDIHDSRRGQLAYQYDPVGRLLQATSRLGVETFAFDPAGNLLDEKTQQLNRPLDQAPKRNRLMDNLLREYAGTHYTYDVRGNLAERLHNGVRAQFTWDLFDRLQSYSDDKLKVEYSYDALGRRLHKHSVAHYSNKPQAGTGWNQLERAKRQRELDCGFTLFGWDGDTLAWESAPPRDEGDTGRTVHYLYEPGSFVPVAQALRRGPVRLHKQPDWSQRSYDFDQDPLWQTHMPPQAFDALAWYQCDHLGTPMELTDHNGEMAWAGQYKAWGEVREERSVWATQVGLSNPLRFQGQYHDRETGLHYNRYRYYDPGVGRFVSKDPISYAGGLNLYLYAPNPIEWTDPLGLEKVVAARSRAHALRLAQQHAQVPRVGRGGEDITTQQLRVESRGKNYACLCARDSTLGREEIGGQAQVFDHPDGHPHLVGEGFPAHHDGPHVHAKNKKGEGIIFTYPGVLK